MADEALRTTTYMLTTADALAFEQAAARMTPLGTLSLLLWLGLWGSSAMLVPTEWAGPRATWPFAMLVSVLLAIGYVLALLLSAVRQWLRARRRVRGPVEVTLSEFAGHVEVSGDGLPRTLPLAEIRRTLTTRTHLFLEGDETVVIVPRRAYPEVGAFEALTSRVALAPRTTAPPTVDPPAATA